MYCSVLQRVATCCSVFSKSWYVKLRCVRFSCAWSMSTSVAVWCSVVQRVAACCSVLQRVAACCSVLQCM